MPTPTATRAAAAKRLVSILPASQTSVMLTTDRPGPLGAETAATAMTNSDAIAPLRTTTKPKVYRFKRTFRAGCAQRTAAAVSRAEPARRERRFPWSLSAYAYAADGG